MSPLSQEESAHRLEVKDKILSASKENLRAMVGLDGFIDTIIHVVDKRFDFENYQRLEMMKEFGDRVNVNAGKSCNIEFDVQEVKIGGNGPLMAASLGSFGIKLLYVGAVGKPDISEVFLPLKNYGKVVSVCNPGTTDAVEFSDGKIMLGKLNSLKSMTWENILKEFHSEENFVNDIKSCKLIALTNWTMLPFANEIFLGLFEYINDDLNPLLFFDLADPAKRTKEDLKGVIDILSTASKEGKNIILGLNHSEALQVANVLELQNVSSENDADTLKKLAIDIQTTSGISEIVIHPRERAIAASNGEAWHAEGPFTAKPKLSTGAGDNFNGVYSFGRLIGLEPKDALVTGVSASGFYVRNGRGANPDEICGFIDNWSNNDLD